MNDRYSVFPIHFVKRSRALLDQGDKASCLYAALELRLGIESRIQPYIHASDQISKSLKKGWHVAKLAKGLEHTASDGKLVSVITFKRTNPTQELTIKFVPLSKELIEIYERLGDFLHYRESDHHFNEKWWQTLPEIVHAGLVDLAICAEGTLLGVPLMRNGTSEVDLKIEMEHGDPRFNVFTQLADTKEIHQTIVEYVPVDEYYSAAR